MTHLTTDNLTKILDRLVDRPSWKKVMQSIGASEATAFVWRSASIKAAKDDDRSSPFFLEWRGAWDFWHCHAGRARTENIILYESVLRDQAINGIETAVLGPDQKPVYVEDPDLIGVSDEDLRNLRGRTHRYLLDAKGHPVPLMKTEQLPAPLRLRVLEQDKRYIHREERDVQVMGEMTVAKPLQRLPGETRPDLAKLRELAKLSAAERRDMLGAAAFPKDTKTGLVTRANTGAPRGDNRPDDGAELAKPSNPRMHEAPAVKTPDPPRPSYARPATHLDTAEGVGRGVVPAGGFRVR